MKYYLNYLADMSKRKRNSKIVLKLTKKQIQIIEDVWYARYNKAVYNTSTK